MSNFKTKSKQALTILLALLLFFAMVPSSLPGGLAYATEWGNTSTETRGVTISTDKAVYNEGETIRYTIPDFSSSSHDAFGNNQLWLGLYNYGADDGYTKSIKWEYINSDIEDNSLQEDLGYTFAPGKYHLIVTTGGGGNDVNAIWATLDFTVVGNSITTDKDTYQLSEPIMTTANFTGDGDFWVGLYGKDENPAGGPQSIYWYAGHNGEAFNVKDGTKNRDLTPGEYKVILFGDSGYSNPVAVKNITIIEDQVTTSISTDKDVYEKGEPIMVTATSSVDGVWVSLLAKSDSVNDGSYYWYYVSAHNGEPFNIYNAEKNKDVTDDGYYKLVVIQDVSGAYTALAEKEIFIGEYKEPDIKVDKEADTDGYAPYKYGEPVLVTAQGSDASTKVRVCDANAGDPHGFDNGEYVSFYVKDVTGSVDVVKMAAEQGTPLVYGKSYRAYLCINQDGNPNSWVKQAKFKLVETFGNPTWKWNDTFTKATATFTSKSDSTVTKTVEVTGTDITYEVTKEATEEEEGIRTYTATIAADKINFVTENDPPFTGTATEAIPKLSHVHEIVKVSAVEATCETDGNTEYFKCTGCNKYFEDAEGTKEITNKNTVVIPAKGHVWGKWTFDEATKTHTRVCANDPTHTEKEACTFEEEEIDDGIFLCTCTVCKGEYTKDTNPEIKTDKEVYDYGEEITVTTDVKEHTSRDGWVALYYKDSQYNMSLMWFYPQDYPEIVLQTIKGPDGKGGMDLGDFTWDKNGNLPVGDYELVYAYGPDGVFPYDIMGKPVYFSVVLGVKSEEVTKEPTCTEKGIKHIIYDDDTEEDVEIDALGHDPKEEWVYDGEKRVHYHVCSRCGERLGDEDCTFDEGKVAKEPTANKEGEMLYTCTVCGGTYTEAIPALADQGVKRVYGSTRYQTALLQANEFKKFLGKDKFDAVIVATGTNYADALSGSYLGYVKEAPILLVRNTDSKVIAEVKDYIKNNLKEGGTVYLLGGEAVVTGAVTEGLDNVKSERLWGATRYETNIDILKAAGVGKEEILVCDGNGFADSLSASATKRPILLVKGGLNDTQRKYLKSLPGNDFYLIGGEGVLPEALKKELENDFGAVTRLGGADRYETSVNTAKEFFSNPQKAVLAYSMDYPDGLCGGTLAAYMNAPLLLVRNDKLAASNKYTKDLGIKSGVVLGGPALVSDGSVRSLFEMKESDEIYVIDKMVPGTV